MDHQQFFSSVADGNLSKCYLFEGVEEFTKYAALERVKAIVEAKDFPEMNMSVMKNPSADAIIAACETLPFGSDQRLVIVKECSMLSGEKTRDYDESDSAEQLKEYIPQMPDSTCLVFFARGKADSRKKLYNVLKKSAEIVTFDTLSDAELEKWTVRRFQRNGRMIDREACTRLFFTCGKELNTLANEIDKLCAYTEGKEAVQQEDIAAMCAETLECKVFDLSEVLFSGQGKRAFQILDVLYRDGEQSLMLLSLIGRYCRQLLYASQFRDKYSVSAALGVPAFAAQKLLDQCKLYTGDELRKMPEWCMKTEYEIKSGVIPEEGALETLMLRILALRDKVRK